MTKTRKLLLALVAATTLTTAGAQPQDWPQKPIRIVVPFTPGGAVDTIARVVAQKIADPLGQPVVVENRVGASGHIGMDHVAKSKADGYTLLMTASPMVVSPALYAKLPFDTTKDFSPITMAVESPNVLVVGKDHPARNIQELFAMGRKNPGKLTYAATSPLFLLMAEVISKRAELGMVRVAYKGAGDAFVDVSQARVDVMLDTVGNQVPHIRAGAVRALAVLSKNRHPKLPDVPTLAESGLTDFDESGWIGFAAPAGMPPAILARLNKEIVAALQSPDVRDRLNGMGFVVKTTSPEETLERVKRDVRKYIQAAEAAGLEKQ